MMTNLPPKITSSLVQKDVFFQRFVNLLMKDGKKSRAHKLIMDTLEILVQEGVPIKKSPNILQEAIENMQPSFHLRGVRKRGRVQEVPAILPIHRKQALAIRWLLEGAHAKKKRLPNKPFSFHLAKEIIEALRKEALGVRKRQELHRQVEKNRASARMRWWRK